MGQNSSSPHRMHQTGGPFRETHSLPTSNMTEQLNQYQSIQAMNNRMQQQFNLDHQLRLEQFGSK